VQKGNSSYNNTMSSTENKKDRSAMLYDLITKWQSVKQKIAGYLQHKTECLSMQSKRCGLVFFCVVFGGSSVALIIHAVTFKNEPVHIATIAKGSGAGHTNEAFMRKDSVIRKAEYDKVMRVKNLLLDLQADSAGRMKFDSIILERPELLDSIAMFEKMYLSQK
jgi:hypothetical protein